MQERSWNWKKKISEKMEGKMTRDNFLILILAGILILVILWPVDKKDGKKDDQSELWDNETDILNLQPDMEGENTGSDKAGDGEEMRSYAAMLEQSLEELLGTMEGVGRVRVMVTLRDSGEAVVEKDQSRIRSGSTQVDAAGGSRNTTDISESDETVYRNDQKSASLPYVKQVLSPKVEGVAVSAEGGGNPQIVQSITEAIQALFGIEAHKIKIVKMISQ